MSPTELAEKLCPPRALCAIGPCLYGPPTEGSSRAWLSWLSVPPPERAAGIGTAALGAVTERAHADRASSLTAGGPPGNYLVSGVDARDTGTLGWLTKRGFSVRGGHVDLVVSTRFSRALEPVARHSRDDTDAVLAWIAASFSVAWAMEAERAIAHDGLFVAHRDGLPVGFATHSGNLAMRATFGPIGVSPSARGEGLGRRLAQTALCDLGSRGHPRAVVPWVSQTAARFYASFCEVSARIERLSLTMQCANIGA